MSDLIRVHEEIERRLGHIGKVVTAGGAVRDYLMGREPKDYDVFLIDYCSLNDEQLADALRDLPGIEAPEWHKSEPFLVGTYEVLGQTTQIMTREDTS